MDKRQLAILRCPVTQKGLSVLKKAELARVNAAIDTGNVADQDGSIVAEALTGALITDDGKRLYPLHDGIPVLLEDKSIIMEQIA